MAEAKSAQVSARDGMRGPARAGRLLRRAAWLRCSALGLALLVGPGLSTDALRAQDAPNPLLTFNFSSSLNVSDNYDLDPDPAGTTTFLDNRLGISYASETATQSLYLGASGVYRLADLPETGSDAGFDDPRLDLDYAREGADARLFARANYNRADIAFFDPLRLIDEDEEILDEDLRRSSDGYREILNASLGFQTGLSSPLGFGLTASTIRRDYTDADPSFEDSTTDRLTGNITLQPSEITAYTISASHSRYTADDEEGTDRITRSLSLGVQHEMARGLTLSGSLGYQRIEDEETNFGTTEDIDSVIATFGAVQEMPNGTLGFFASQSASVSGIRRSVSVERALSLPGGELSASIGVSKGEDDKATLIGNLAYAHDLANGRLVMNLSRTAGTNSREEDQETTRASITWTHALTPVSGLTLGAEYADVTGDTDNTRGRLRASYSHDLTADWALEGGYQYSAAERSSGHADSNRVYLTISRDFQFRP